MVQKYSAGLTQQAWSFITQHWLLCVFCFSLAIRLTTLGSERFWYDERFTSLISELSIGKALQALAADVHPPLWYAITWIMTRILGSGELSLRLPAALLSALACCELYKIVAHAADKKSAMAASAMMAILPGQLYYGQEARMYALLTYLVLLSVRALQTKSWRRLVIVGTLAMYTHNLAALYLAPVGAAALITGRSKLLRQLPIALAYAPWSLVAWHQMQAVSSAYWISDPGSVGAAFYFILYGTISNRLPDWAQWHGVIAVATVTATSLIAMRKVLRKSWILLLMSSAPSALMYTITVAWRPIMLDRVLIPSSALLIGVWSIGLVNASSYLRKIMLLIGAPMAIMAIGSFYFNPDGGRTNYDPLIDAIKRNFEPGDVIYHNSMDTVVLFNQQLEEYPNYILPGNGDLSQSLSEDTKGAMGITEQEIDLIDLDRKYKRAWLFYRDTSVTTQMEHDTIERDISRYRMIDCWTISESKFDVFEIVLLDITTAKPDDVYRTCHEQSAGKRIPIDIIDQ
jgi:hypothetical protein